MITIYKDKKDIHQEMEYVELNDIFFNQNATQKLDENARKIIIIESIDGAKLLGKYKIESKFNGVILDIDCLSTGRKTVLNVLYYLDKVFCMKECGKNALEILYALKARWISLGHGRKSATCWLRSTIDMARVSCWQSVVRMNA